MPLSRVGSGVGGAKMLLWRVSGADGIKMLLVCSGADAVAFDMNVQRPMGGARDSQHAQAGPRRAAHHLSLIHI